MATIVGYSEVESVYQTIKATGVTQVIYGMSLALAVVITVWKMANTYWKGVDDGKPRDMKKFINILKPLLPFLFIAVSMPFILSFVEFIFAEMEGLILGKIGSQPSTAGFIQGAQDESDMLDETYGSGWSMMDMELWISYIGVVLFKPLMIFTDNYLFSMALAGRFLYLLILEIVFPLVLVASLFEKTKDWLWAWVKNMFACYLLIPAFMMANFFAETLFEVYTKNGDYGFIIFLFLIALKLFLYKVAASKVLQIVK